MIAVLLLASCAPVITEEEPWSVGIACSLCCFEMV